MSVATASAAAIDDSHHQRQILNKYDVKYCEQFAAQQATELKNSIVPLHHLNSDGIRAASSVTAPPAAAAATIAGGAPPASPPSQHQLPHQSTLTSLDNASTSIDQHRRLLEDEIQSLKVDQKRLVQQCTDAQRREKILMRRLANKEQEFQDYVGQIAEYKASQAPGAAALRSALLDPAVNLLFKKLKKELQATKAKLEDTQNELAAWKFTPDSNTGKRLMAKCRLLYQENEELGKMTSNGRLAKLEAELAMQKSFSEEVKKSQSELDDFLQELDEDVEGMQSTILFLQQELKTTRDRIQSLEKENYQLKSGAVDEEDSSQPLSVPHTAMNGILSETPEATAAAAPSAGSMTYLNSTIATAQPITTTNQTDQLLLHDHLQSIDQSTNNKLLTNSNFNSHQNSTLSSTPIAAVLETIDENLCLRTSTTISNLLLSSGSGSSGKVDGSELVNGGSTGNQSLSAIVAVATVDDVSSSNSSNSVSVGCVGAGSGANKLRLTNSRKRNYDSDSSDCGNVLVAAVNTAARPAVGEPSTRKSKKKSAATTTTTTKTTMATVGRSSSVLSIDLNDEDDLVSGGGDIVVATEHSDIEDDGNQMSTGGLAAGPALPTQATPTLSAVSGGNQRVITRRKSARNHQPNGDY